MGALNQLNCGTTTLADWCHNNPTPAHNDAAIDGLIHSLVYAPPSCTAHPSPTPSRASTPFWEVPHPRVPRWSGC